MGSSGRRSCCSCRKIENNTVTYSNSAYNGTNFYLSTAPLSDPGNVGATDWTLQGYIYAYTPPISNTSSGIVNNLSAPQFERQFATFFEAKGFNKAMICGMLGNILGKPAICLQTILRAMCLMRLEQSEIPVAYACGTEITVQDLSETARIGELM